jgi:hypothetical protein
MFLSNTAGVGGFRGYGTMKVITAQNACFLAKHRKLQNCRHVRHRL